MVSDIGPKPEIYTQFRNIVNSVDQLVEHGRFELYEACKKENFKLAIAQGNNESMPMCY
jgi:hypothetical protein